MRKREWTTRAIGAVAALIWLASSPPVHSEDLVLEGYQVYEKDPNRFATNANGPSLYQVRLTLKEDALWIEGDDLNYEWLTIAPYAGISRVVMNRSRRNPYDDGTGGGWLGKQLAKATDLKGWFVIDFTDRRGKERQVIVLAPVQGEDEFLNMLESRLDLAVVREGEPLEAAEEPPTVPQHASVPVAAAPPMPAVDAAKAASATAPGPIRLMDLMSVSDFRACGLNKLSDEELEALDAWLSRNVARR